MSEKFTYYKEIRVICFCKARLPDGRQCSISFSFHRTDYRTILGLCYPHRKEYNKKRYHEYYIPYFNALPPEKRQWIKKARYEAWRKWVQAHLPYRRVLSLKSYHKRKHAHVRGKMRK